jgi:hypothetical protein
LKNYSASIGLFFIEDFIFLVKKNFLTKFQKLAAERNFDLQPSVGKTSPARGCGLPGGRCGAPRPSAPARILTLSSLNLAEPIFEKPELSRAQSPFKKPGSAQLSSLSSANFQLW